VEEEEVSIWQQPMRQACGSRIVDSTVVAVHSAQTAAAYHRSETGQVYDRADKHRQRHARQPRRKGRFCQDAFRVSHRPTQCRVVFGIRAM
jgi:hypothetical protein